MDPDQSKDGAGDKRPSLDEFYDDSAPVYRSLPSSTVADQAARLSLGSRGSPLDGEPKYRDAPDFAGPGGALFDDSDQPVYRSLPAFAGGDAALGGGPSYRSMGVMGPQAGAFDGGEAAMLGARKGYDPQQQQRRQVSADAALAFSAPKGAPVPPVPTPPPVPRPPFRLEASHVTCGGGSGSQDVGACLAALSTLFKVHQVEANFKHAPHKCRFKCTAFPGYERVEFKVFLYTKPAEVAADGSQLVVEFQRRAGGALHFASLYRDIVEGLRKQKICAAAPAAPAALAGAAAAAPAAAAPTGGGIPAPPALVSQASFEPPALPFEFTSSTSSASSSSSSSGGSSSASDPAASEACYGAAQSLITMARELQHAAAEGGMAANGEASREAAGALAVISSTKSGAAVIAMQGGKGGAGKDAAAAAPLLNGVVELLESPCGDVQRLAAVVIANVCEQCPEAHGAIVAETGAVRSLVWLAQHAGEPTGRAPLPATGRQGKTLSRSSGGVESVRHCVRALAKLSASHSAAIEAVGGIEILEQLAARYRDDQVSLYAAECMVSAKAPMYGGAGVTVS